MKRIVVRVLVFLLIGAVINVAVAWACVLATEWESIPDAWRVQKGVSWPGTTPTHWPASAEHRSARMTWLDYDHFTAYTDNSEGGRLPLSENFVVDRIRAGWPFRSNQYWVWDELIVSRDDIVETTSSETRSVNPSASVWRDGLPLPQTLAQMQQNVWKRLPIAPLALGFAANTVIYGAIAWICWVVPARMRRASRVRRGLCMWCGYPLGTSTVCTECGRPVKAKAAAA